MKDNLWSLSLLYFYILRRWITSFEIRPICANPGGKYQLAYTNTFKDAPNREAQLEVLKRARQLRAEIRKQHGKSTTSAIDILKNIRCTA